MVQRILSSEEEARNNNKGHGIMAETGHLETSVNITSRGVDSLDALDEPGGDESD